MTKVKEDISRVRVQVDGKQAINELGKLEMEAKELKIDMKGAKRNTDEYVAANKKLNEVSNRIKQVREQLGLAGMTMGQLIRYQKDLTREYTYGATQGTQRYKELQIEIRRVNDAIRSQRAELNGTKGFFAGLSKEIKSFGVLALGYLGAGAFLGQVQSMIQGSAKLSDELSDVQKTTGLTDKELSQLSQTLKNMDTRTPRSELRGLAEIAGRLGIKGVKDIEGFVSAADKINVALGDVLGDPEKVMRELGKLTSTFGVTQEFGIEQGLLKVGSAINELGMASTANEGYLVEFTKRMGGIAPLAKISIENVLGLGATLDSLGQTSEVSSTALSKLFIAMAKNSEAFARFAKMEGKDFVKLMNEDANEAFLRVLEGVKSSSNGITELAATLGDLGQDGGRVVGVLGTLANNTETLRKQQEIANNAFREGTSVINEFNLKNENMAANLAKVQKWIAGLFINSSVMESLNSFVSLWAKWIQIPISQKLEDERMQLNKLYSQIITTNEGTAERVKLINELKSMYPELLKNINADTVSNHELSLAVKAVNEQLVNKLILQKQNEKIEDQLNVIATRKEKVFEREDSLREQAIRLSEKYNFELKQGVSNLEQFTDAAEQAEKSQGKMGQMLRGRLFNDVANFKQGINQLVAAYENLNTAENFGTKMSEERNELMKRLGINLDEFKSADPFGGTDPVEPDNNDPVVPDPNIAAQKFIDLEKLWQDYLAKVDKTRRDFELSQLDADEREKERVKEKYHQLELDLASHFEKKAISEQEFTLRLKELEELRNMEIAAIEDKYRQQQEAKKLAAEQKITEATMGERELAELKINQHYDSLLELARQFGIDETGIHEQRLKALDELASKYRQKEIQEEIDKYAAKKQMVMDFASAATGMIGLVANFTGEVAAYDRAIAIAKAAINSGEAIANMVKMFSSTSFTPIQLAARIAAGTGIILGNINNALRTINRTSLPQSPTEPKVDKVPTRGRITTPPRTSYYFGGPTSGGLGFGDQFGEFAGYVHKKEYVVPSIVTQDPWVANLLPAIESIRQDKIRGFANGGPTDSSSGGRLSVSTPMGSDPEVKELLRLMVKKLDMMPKQVRAYLVYNDLEEMQEEMETLKSRYTA
jgi:TP901 family phage tail tape measure protein